MDYLIGFDDGSKAIMHYGVRGMKWGEWNEETSARYRSEGKSINGGAGSSENISEEESEAGVAKPLGPDMSKPIDEHWREFATGAKQYADNVVETGNKWGNDANKAGDSLNRLKEDLERGDLSSIESDLKIASSTVSEAAKSGSEYVLALLGHRKR